MLQKKGLIALAPLAGYSDRAYREIAIKMGADISVTEMVSAEGVRRKSEKTTQIMEPFDGEKRLVIQLFGSDPSSFRGALDEVLKREPEIIDINAGCPVEKVVKTGAGCALMKNMKRTREIIHVLKEESGKRISIKFRLGWDKDSINYLEFAENALLAGAEILTLHARTRKMGYSGEADWSAFKELKSRFKDDIYLFASGDIFKAEDAIRAMNEYMADGAMIARGAIGNPFIFRETKALLENRIIPPPSLKERIDTALCHYDLMAKYSGERVASKEMRKVMPMYIKGIEGAKGVKSDLVRCSSRDEFYSVFNRLEDKASAYKKVD